ncbi:MAG: hypothetical protein ACLUQW_07170, partial [Collinsella sp.]
KARHDQKVYALPFSCQLVRSGRRSLTYAQPATFPLLMQRGQVSLRQKRERFHRNLSMACLVGAS